MAILLLGLLPIPPKLAKSSRANKLQRLINADTLRGLFKLIFALLNRAAREGAPIDCADGKIRGSYHGELRTIWKMLPYMGSNPMPFLNVGCLQKN